MKKQTAVDFYREHLMALVSTGKTDYKTEPEIFKQAKELEKQQIIEAVDTALQDANLYESFRTLNDGKQYYNETFNNEKI